MRHSAPSVLSYPGNISLQLKITQKLTLNSRPPFDSMSKASVSGFEFTMVGRIATPSEANGETVTVKL